MLSALMGLLLVLFVLFGWDLSGLFLLLAGILSVVVAWWLWREGTVARGFAAGGHSERHERALAAVPEGEADIEPENARVVSSPLAYAAAQSVVIADPDEDRERESQNQDQDQEDDDDDGLAEMIGGDLIAGAIAGRYEIDYEDAKGNRATRTIAVYAIVERSDVINLDCFSADQISCRTYRADRIRRLKDLTTGKIVEGDIVAWLTEPGS